MISQHFKAPQIETNVFAHREFLVIVELGRHCRSQCSECACVCGERKIQPDAYESFVPTAGCNCSLDALDSVLFDVAAENH